MTKFLQTLDDKIFKLYEEEAAAKGLTVQELTRSLIAEHLKG